MDGSERFNDDDSAGCSNGESFVYSSPYDSLCLRGRNWSVTENECQAVVLVVHGSWEHSGRYSHMTHFFNNHHIASVAFDAQDHGLSSGERDHTPNLDALPGDLECIISRIRTEFYPKVPLVINSVLSCSAKQRFQIIICYITLAYTVTTCTCLQCYACSGGSECGISFSPDSKSTTQVRSNADGFFDSCSISVSQDGLTTRSLVLSYECHSSERQFCCKEDFCNSLPSPPLPAFTTLKCVITRCTLTSSGCASAFYVASLSSATESCLGVRVSSDIGYYSYKKGCSPGKLALFSESYPSVGDSFCCNSPQCNRQDLPLKLKINCFSCDSRVTGMKGCSTLNTSSLHVYESGSSISSEACAMIIGFPVHDPSTNISYPAFTIRTLIADCENQSGNNVSYGGANFQGRIKCCWTNHCNNESEFLHSYLSEGWFHPLVIEICKNFH
ncbi:unnamed protein product [Rotaria magnacalcarata]